MEGEVLVVAEDANEAATFAESEPDCLDSCEMIAHAVEAKRSSTCDEELASHPFHANDESDGLTVGQWLDVMEERERQAFAQAEFAKKQLKLPGV
jgi:hypothetical protein